MFLGVFMPLSQFFPVLLADGDGGVAALPIAVDMVFSDAFVNEFDGLQGLLPKPAGLFQTDLFFDFFHTAGVIADDLPAAASRCAEAYAGGFEYDHFVSVFGKGEGGAKSCQSSADNAGLGFQTTFKLGISGVGIDGAEIIGGKVFFKIGMNHRVMLCVVSDDFWGKLRVV